MRSINWNSVTSSNDGGDYERLEPGAYVCAITEMRDVPGKEYVQMLFDIAEGPHKGYFSDSFYSDKPWAHNLIMSYKDTALGMLKGRLETIQSCNPGFDPFAAWDAGRLELFVGRKVGVVMREEEYFDRRGETFKLGSPRCFRLCKLEDVTSGKYAEVKARYLDVDAKRAALERVGYGQYDIDRIIAADSLSALGGAGAASAPATTTAGDFGPVPFD